MNNSRHRPLPTVGLVAALAATGPASAALTLFQDESEWGASAGAYSTIDFVDLGAPPQVLITDQYEHLGVVVDPLEEFVTSTFGLDGVGARNVDFDDDVRIGFTEPITHFAVLHIAIVRFNLYRDGELIDEAPFQIGPFNGIASDVPFDEVEIIDFDGFVVNIDNMYLSAIPAPGVLAVLLPAAVLGRRRRRSN